MTDGRRDPRVALAARTTAMGLTMEAATHAALRAKLVAEPTDGELDAEAERIIAEAKPEDFEPGHTRRVLLDLKERVLKERAAEGNPLAELDRRMAQESELDRRIGLVRRT